jgi:hypothetical protein
MTPKETGTVRDRGVGGRKHMTRLWTMSLFLTRKGDGKGDGGESGRASEKKKEPEGEIMQGLWAHPNKRERGLRLIEGSMHTHTSLPAYLTVGVGKGYVYNP